ncbi:MAG: hypothetical protein ACKO26_13710 [Planctomycetota bacterium]
MPRNHLVVMLSFALACQSFAQDTTTTAPTTTSGSGGATNLMGMILPNASQLAAIKAACAKCKAKLCSCCLGQMLGNMTLPLSLATGGCIKPCCPPVSQEALKAPASSAAGACARITKDQLEIEERRKAVRCLAKVDCNWYPEAELALITSLRTDKSECVRLDAARVLAVGCCATKRTIETLTVCVNGSSADGNPPENSPRVREMALVALQRALNCYVEKEEPVRPEVPAMPMAPAPPAGAAPPPALRPAAFTARAQDADDDAAPVVATPLRGRIILSDPASPGAAEGMKGARPAQAAADSKTVISQAMQAVRRGKAVMPARSGDCPTLAREQRSLTGLFAYAMKSPPPANISQGESAARPAEMVIPADRGLVGSPIQP